MITSFWSTPEVDAWSRGFDYAEYLRLCNLAAPAANPLSELGYQRLCDLLNSEYESTQSRSKLDSLIEEFSR